MALGSERAAVQNPLIHYAEQAGWTYLSRAEAERLRRGTDKPFLYETLVQQLQRLNPGVVDLLRAQEVIRRLSILSPTIEGNLNAREYLRGLKKALFNWRDEQGGDFEPLVKTYFSPG
mgnify:CR=1 FL=1